MKIYPAIDLIGGKVVRLEQGQFDRQTNYSIDPLQAAQKFADAGAQYLHVVDLDGARTSQPQNRATVIQIAASTNLKIQLGGGIGSWESARFALDGGIDRVVIGSWAIREPKQVKSVIREFGSDRITLALDCRVQDGVPYVSTHGWQQISEKTLWEVIEEFLPGPFRILCTDVSRDGMQNGSHVELYEKIRARFPSLDIQASGGVCSLEEVSALKKLGVESCVLGKSLYEGTFSLEEALARC